MKPTHLPFQGHRTRGLHIDSRCLVHFLLVWGFSLLFHFAFSSQLSFITIINIVFKNHVLSKTEPS